MKKYVITSIILILITFAGCTTSRKVAKQSKEVNIQNDIKSSEVNSSVSTTIASGKAVSTETKTDETVTIKNPVQPQNIELTANFKIDTSSTLQGDTALKLVDVTDKNVSITVYQNRKTNVLTAKIKSKFSTQDVPFSEMIISKSSSTKSSEIDTTKSEKIESNQNKSLIEKSKFEETATKNSKEVSKVNYSGVIIFSFALIFILFFVFKKRG